MLSAYIDTEELKYTEDIFYGCLKFFLAFFSVPYQRLCNTEGTDPGQVSFKENCKLF